MTKLRASRFEQLQRDEARTKNSSGHRKPKAPRSGRYSGRYESPYANWRTVAKLWANPPAKCQTSRSQFNKSIDSWTPSETPSLSVKKVVKISTTAIVSHNRSDRFAQLADALGKALAVTREWASAHRSKQQLTQLRKVNTAYKAGGLTVKRAGYLREARVSVAASRTYSSSSRVKSLRVSVDVNSLSATALRTIEFESLE